MRSSNSAVRAQFSGAQCIAERIVVGFHSALLDGWMSPDWHGLSPSSFNGVIRGRAEGVMRKQKAVDLLEHAIQYLQCTNHYLLFSRTEWLIDIEVCPSTRQQATAVPEP